MQRYAIWHANVFGDQPGPCPALLVADDRTTACGLTTIGTQEARNAARVLISAGDGCDARFNGEPMDPSFHAHQARLDLERAAEIRAARRTWGLPVAKGEAARGSICVQEGDPQ